MVAMVVIVVVVVSVQRVHCGGLAFSCILLAVRLTLGSNSSKSRRSIMEVYHSCRRSRISSSSSSRCCSSLHYSEYCYCY